MFLGRLIIVATSYREPELQKLCAHCGRNRGTRQQRPLDRTIDMRLPKFGRAYCSIQSPITLPYYPVHFLCYTLISCHTALLHCPFAQHTSFVTLYTSFVTLSYHTALLHCHITSYTSFVTLPYHTALLHCPIHSITLPYTLSSSHCPISLPSLHTPFITHASQVEQKRAAIGTRGSEMHRAEAAVLHLHTPSP